MAKVCHSTAKGPSSSPVSAAQKKPFKKKPWSKQGKAKVHSLPASVDEDEDLSDILTHMFSLPDKYMYCIWIDACVAGVDLTMELDTGSKVSVLPIKMYNEHFSHIPLEQSKLHKKTYMG